MAVLLSRPDVVPEYDSSPAVEVELPGSVVEPLEVSVPEAVVPLGEPVSEPEAVGAPSSSDDSSVSIDWLGEKHAGTRNAKRSSRPEQVSLSTCRVSLTSPLGASSPTHKRVGRTRGRKRDPLRRPERRSTLCGQQATRPKSSGHASFPTTGSPTSLLTRPTPGPQTPDGSDEALAYLSEIPGRPRTTALEGPVA